MTDAQALAALAERVRAGLPIPTPLQALANEAMTRAVGGWKMPRRAPGRPKGSGRSLDASVTHHALLSEGLSAAEATRATAAAVGLSERRVQQVAASGDPIGAFATVKAQPESADLVLTDAGYRAGQAAVRAVDAVSRDRDGPGGVASVEDFDDLRAEINPTKENR